MNKMISVILSSIIFMNSSVYAFEQNTEYLIKIDSIKNETKTNIYKKNSEEINYTNLINMMNENLFNGNMDEVVLEVVNRTTNKKIEEKKKTEFIPKYANTILNQDGSAFGKTMVFEKEDSDGMYVGFIEDHLSSVSRGYYVKRYSKYSKEDGILREYIVLGKANYVKDFAEAIIEYKDSNRREIIEPLLMSYVNYTDTYALFKEPNEYKENSFGWNGLISLGKAKTSQEIESKLNSLKYPLGGIEGRDFGKLVNGTNNIFLEDGKVYQYKTNEKNEEVFSHLSLANTFMANNNLKRGYILKPTNSLNNYKFDNFKHCSGKIRKKCKYWQTMTYKGGMDVYTMSFLDESYIDDWNQIPFSNRDIQTGSVVLSTMTPIKTNSYLPSINANNYGLLYSNNYSGSIGGLGLYNYPLFNIDGLNGTTRTIKSDVYTTKGFSMSFLKLITFFYIGPLSYIPGVRETFWKLIESTGILTPFLYPLVYVLKHLIQDKNFETGNLSDEANRKLISLTNSITPQGYDEKSSFELTESATLQGLIANSETSNSSKNFLSTTFHDVASKHSKNNLTEVNKNYFESNIPVLAQMDSQKKFWHNQHKDALINSYKLAFYNDGKNMVKSGDYASFYDMSKIFRSITKEYLGY